MLSVFPWIHTSKSVLVNNLLLVASKTDQNPINVSLYTKEEDGNTTMVFNSYRTT